MHAEFNSIAEKAICNNFKFLAFERIFLSLALQKPELSPGSMGSCAFEGVNKNMIWKIGILNRLIKGYGKRNEKETKPVGNIKKK